MKSLADWWEAKKAGWAQVIQKESERQAKIIGEIKSARGEPATDGQELGFKSAPRLESETFAEKCVRQDREREVSQFGVARILRSGFVFGMPGVFEEDPRAPGIRVAQKVVPQKK